MLSGEQIPSGYFPTAATITYISQIPAIAFEKLDAESGEERPNGSGITVVVSPLIALMKDQVDALKHRGIPADCLDSTKTYEESKAISAAMREGRLRLLYCAPEKLNNEGFVESMAHVPGGIRLLAVDEAHCISEWGHSFRPDYLKIARFASEVQAESVICLTATATPRVADDVQAAFDIADSNVYRTSPYRPNLQLNAESTETKAEKYPKLYKFLNTHRGSTLIYVTQQQQTETLAKKLRDKGFNALSFHAGMKTEDKMRTQDQFMVSQVPIIVATIAFGMGIDKADIRNIVHFELPSTVEEYSQQIGRAGRDGLQSHCILYLCPEDFYIKEMFARADLPAQDSVLELLKDIFAQPVIEVPKGKGFKLNHNQLSQNHDVKANPLSIIMAILELRFGLIRAITPEYTSYKFQASATYNTFARSERSPEGRAIFDNAKKAVTWYDIDVGAVAHSAGVPRNHIVHRLNELNDLGALALKTGGLQHRYRIVETLPRKDDEIAAIADDLYAEMETRESDALKRLDEVSALITGEQCFALALAQHFGMADDGLPDGPPTGDATMTTTTKAKKMRCGHCTYCVTEQAVQLPQKPEKPVDIDGVKAILDACKARDDPRLLARIAFGIKSPRVTKLRYDRLGVFGSLEEHDFEVSPPPRSVPAFFQPYPRALRKGHWGRKTDRKFPAVPAPTSQ